MAQDSGLQIEFVRKKNFRQEDRIKQILAQRGTAPGLVHIFSALEPCLSFRPWHDKKTGRNFLKPDDGKGPIEDADTEATRDHLALEKGARWRARRWPGRGQRGL